MHLFRHKSVGMHLFRYKSVQKQQSSLLLYHHLLEYYWQQLNLQLFQTLQQSSLMNRFQHKLRTNLHTRSVQNIMTRTHAFLSKSKQYKVSQPKFDNISTYIRKFQIDRQNLNLAKRIMQCESQHNRNKYVKEWKKTKKFLKVRSNFKPQLAAQQPKIYRIEEIPGHGRLVVRLQINEITSCMKQLSSQALYLMKFALGGNQLIPNKDFITFQTAKGYPCVFLAPFFLKNKPIIVKIVKVVQNNLFDAGKFSVELSDSGDQHCEIINKIGKAIGHISFKLSLQAKEKLSDKDQQQKENRYHKMRNSDLLQMQYSRESL